MTINYSLNKNDFYKIISGCLLIFVPHYFIVVILSIVYLYTIRYKKYFFSDRKPEFQKDEDIMHFFKSITYESPFNILTTSENEKNDDKYVGLSVKSYCLIIISYLIALILILEGLIRNLIYSMYVNIVQVNNNNNPYKNNNCITKITNSPHVSVSANYSAITLMSISFLFPFLIPYIIKFIKFDNYDIKHGKWMNYVIIFLIFYPFLIMVLSKASFYNKLEIFSNLKKFINVSDNNFVKSIKEKFDFDINTVIIFLFIIFIFCFYTLIYSDFRCDMKKKSIIYAIIFIIIFLFIPFFILFFALSFVLNNKNINDTSEEDIVNNIQKNGVSGLYDLLVKYNYPCFLINST